MTVRRYEYKGWQVTWFHTRPAAFAWKATQGKLIFESPTEEALKTMIDNLDPKQIVKSMEAARDLKNFINN